MPNFSIVSIEICVLNEMRFDFMKIDIDNPGTKDYYDEFLFIVNNRKKICSNLNIKVYKLSYVAYRYLAISFIIFLIFLFWYLRSNKVLHLFITILFLFLIILSIIYLFLIKKRINKLLNSFSKTEFAIENECVFVESNEQKYKLKFDEIKGIIMGNYTLSFIPKDIKKQFITTRIEYKDEIIKALKKYNKDKLIIK